MDLTGRSLKHYVLNEELGAGGMGVVYRARDTVLDRDVAIKVLPADTVEGADARRRFHREARAASALNHPSVVAIYEIGSADGIDFIAMEYVPGQTLRELLRRRLFSAPEAARYAFQIADALAKAHAAGVVHRDLKPGNIMITDDGLVKVLDFGIARLSEAAAPVPGDATTKSVFATREGIALGTVAYMSPEQGRGEEAGPQSDIFSLGIVLFEMLSGQKPFGGDTDLARLHSLHFSPPKDLRVVSPDLPDGLVRVVQRMLEKDLGARYASMAEVRQALGPFVGHAPDPAAAPSSPDRARHVVDAPRPPRRAVRRIALAGVALLAIAAAIGVARVAWMSMSAARVPGAGELAAPVAEPASPYDLVRQARALLDRFDREGNVVRAIELLERAVEQDNTHALAHATLAEAYRHRFSSAPDEQWRNLMTQSARRALTLDPELGAAHIAMGLSLMGQPGQSAAAERHLERAIELDPRNPVPLIWMAVLLGSTGQRDQARERLDRALALAPGHWRALLELGLINYRAAQYAEAAAAWEQARESAPDSVRVLANLAAAYHMLDRTEDAASTLQRAIEIEPAAPHYSNLGTLRFFQGRYEEAIAPLEKAVELRPSQYRSWGNLADAYRWAPGHRGKAGQAYARAIELLREQIAANPADAELGSVLALYLAKSGDASGALAQLAALEPKLPDTAAVLFRVAVAYEVAGDRDRALRTIERALAAGYAEKEIRREPELVHLRNDVRYHRLVSTASGAAAR
jgi:eukaryotic-like serine/threonine-protein kinase